ncbi:hypothetical protein BVG19_g1411 [[Candida] boidinii]|nr:hypothetical protein BVG19_g1411 [[Candida] boidinii]OWB50874.1 hypothetical protein B5S27_g2427 [[Candida] boidinii]
MAKRSSKKILNSKGLKGALSRHKLENQNRDKVLEKANNLKTLEQNKKDKANGVKNNRIAISNDNDTKNQEKSGSKTDSTSSDNKKVRKNYKPYIPFNRTDNILLIGEGDFSYTKSIIENGYVNPAKIITTAYDSFEDLQNKYGENFNENLRYLQQRNVKIFYSIDAKDLIKSFKLTSNFKKNKNKNFEILNGLKFFNLIIFNFPHTGKGIKDFDRNIKYHQELMVDFYSSCYKFFQLLNKNLEFNNDKLLNTNSVNSSVYESGYSIDKKLNTAMVQKIDENEDIDLSDNANNSSDNSNQTIIDHTVINGKNRIMVTLFEGEPYDSWQIKRLAKEVIKYQVEQSGKFDWNSFTGYSHRRTNSMKDTTKIANTRNAKIYVFKPMDKLYAKKRGEDGSEDEDYNDN